MINEYILLVVTANNCPACDRFKASILEPLKRSLKEKFSNITLTYINKDSPNAPIPSNKIPAVLNQYLKWVPTLLLVPKDQWASSQITKIAIFNGRIMNNSVEYFSKYPSLDIKSIEAFLNSYH